jgi:two-component system CheB/CheR fusion protein
MSRRRRDKATAPTTRKEPKSTTDQSLRDLIGIVGIGASAGGLDPSMELLHALPHDTGLAFVLVQHLDPTHESQLVDILARQTPMPVSTPADNTPVAPNSVYVIPPNTIMILSDGHLRLQPRQPVHGQHMPIDHFLRSLAADRDHILKAAVILSGTGSDGALALKDVKGAGGITFAQEPTSATFDAMPRSAIASGCVDFILPPGKIGEEINRIARAPLAPRPTDDAEQPASGADEINDIFRLLHNATGVDFTLYKRSTVQRRVQRRMAMRHSASVADYARDLAAEHAEVIALYQDLLIHVTSFFRDPESFEALKQVVFPKILPQRGTKEPIRIWVPGCATGEEVYSVAIALLEAAAEMASNLQVQIFGTDLNETVIERARAGVYPENIAIDVSPERLRRFFVKTDGQYQISRTVRDMCIFAQQNVARDPPFSRMDLISCRNLLIYLEPGLQQRLIPVFHYALKPGGFLMLGAAETLGPATDLFTVVDSKNKIYTKVASPLRVSPIAESERAYEAGPSMLRPAQVPEVQFNLQREADRVLLSKYAPTGILIDQGLEILEYRGDIGRYVTPAAGRPSHNLLKMVRDDLKVEVQHAFVKAGSQNAAARVEGVPLTRDGYPTAVNIDVIPVTTGTATRAFWVLFEEESAPAVASPSETPAPQEPGAELESDKDRQIRELRRALDANREYLQSVIEQQEAVYEELKSANEEILSSNEELQSTNEELQTAKEELQSGNEELTTVNEELQNRNQELRQVNDDITNLVMAVDIPLAMVGREFHVRRFAGPMKELGGGRATDVGRSIHTLPLTLEVPDIESLVQQVMETVQPVEREVQDRTGRWHAVRIRPYIMSGNIIDGAVIAFVDIDALKRTQQQINEARAFAEAANRSKDEFLAVLSHELRTPLSAMLTWTRLLRMGKLDEATAARGLEVIERSVQVQTKLIDDLLDVSRIVSGKIRLEVTPIRLAPIIEAALDNHARAAQEKGVDLDVQLDQAAGSVLGDAVRLQPVFSNLIANAIKFTDGGGRISARLEQADDRARVTVSDKGKGISPAALPHIFERFRQEDSSIRRPQSGLGLGLAIVRHLLEMHGGAVRADSPGEGRGATFTVELPLTGIRMDEGEAERVRLVIEPRFEPAPPPSLQGCRVLLVDDEPDARESLMAALQHWGADVVAAASAAEALATFERVVPDILVSDIAMPGVDGYALMEHVRALPAERRGRIPAIALTACTRPEDAERVRTAGFDRHVVKPVDPTQLANLVHELVRRPGHSV